MPTILNSIKLNSSAPNFARDSFDTVEQMNEYVNYPHLFDDGHISYCQETKRHYKFVKEKVTTGTDNTQTENIYAHWAALDEDQVGVRVYLGTDFGDKKIFGEVFNVDVNTPNIDEYSSKLARDSHAEGFNTIATGEASHAEGSNTIAENFNQHSQGQWNTKEQTPSSDVYDPTKTLFAVGNGMSDIERSDALKMLGNGITWIAGIGGFNGTNPTETNSLQSALFEKEIIELPSWDIEGLNLALNDINKFANVRRGVCKEIYKKIYIITCKIGGLNPNTIGILYCIGDSMNHMLQQIYITNDIITISGDINSLNGHSHRAPHIYYRNYGFKTAPTSSLKVGEWSLWKNISMISPGSGLYSAVIGDNNISKSTGDYSIAGGSSLASGKFSVAFGENTLAENYNSFTEGESTTASGLASHAEGSSTIASGDYSHAEGNSTAAAGWASHVEGGLTSAVGMNSHAEGQGTTATGPASHTEGLSCETYTQENEMKYYFKNPQIKISSSNNTISFTFQNSDSICQILNKRLKNSTQTYDSSYKTVNLVYVLSIHDTENNLNYNGEYGNMLICLHPNDWAELSKNKNVYIKTDKNTFGPLHMVYKTTINDINSDLQKIPNYYQCVVLQDADNKEIDIQNLIIDSILSISTIPYSTTPLWLIASSHPDGKKIEVSKDDSHSDEKTTTFVSNNWADTYPSPASANVYIYLDSYQDTSLASHAEGFNSKALGIASHAGGESSKALGAASRAIGFHTQTLNNNEFACGQYNTSSPKVDDKKNQYTIFSVGCGTDENNRKNAFEIRLDNQNEPHFYVWYKKSLSDEGSMREINIGSIIKQP